MRTKLAGVTALCLVAAGLSACADNDDRDRGGGANVAGICSPFNTTNASADPAVDTASTAPLAGEAAAFDDCLHRWGYRLARGEDSADIVAQGVVAVCAPALSRWNAATLAQPQTGTDSAISLVTGETGSSLADRYASAQGKALFYVVQARAGNCSPPPATNTAAAK